MEDLISIVVPVYNVSIFLERCLNSICRQTYPKLQILLINDGSTDDSLSICEQFAQADSRIQVVNKSNGGLSDARNAGIELAKGEYIAFVDSDDYVHTRYIEDMYRSIQQHGSDICMCDFLFVEEGTENLSVAVEPPVLTDYPLSGSYPAHKAMQTICNTYHVVAWNKLYRRTLFDSIRYPVNRIHEDEFILHKLMAASNTVSCVPEILYYYIQRKDSIIGRPYTARRLDILIAYDERVEYYLQNQLVSLLPCTLLGYTQRLVEVRGRLDLSMHENREHWKQCFTRYRRRRPVFFRYGGMLLSLRYILAVISPRGYGAISRMVRGVNR